MKNTEPDIRKLFKVWEDNEMMAKRSAELPAIHLDDLIPSMFSSGPMYYYIIDFFDMSLSNISPSIKEIHGLDPKTVTFNDILALIHPEDMNHVSLSEKTIFDKIYNVVGFEHCTNYKMQYSLRFKTADLSYKLFLHQAIIVSTDQNKVSKSLNIHTDISNITQINNHHASLIGLNGAPSYINIGGKSTEDKSIAGSTGIFFSSREMQILNLIAEGLTNSAIAEQLNLAKDTVKNHRRNIMEKAGVNNTAKLIKKCMMEGVI